MNQIPGSSRFRFFEILVTPGFLLGLSLLLLNDFYLKPTFGNVLTGKLSDFAGLFTFSLFLSALFPTRLSLVYAAVAAAFVWWKTPLADGPIDAWNSLGLMSIARTVDYSDYFALTVLPFSYAYFAAANTTDLTRLHRFRRVGIYLALFVSIFAFGATSSTTDRTVTLPETYEVRQSRVEIEGILLNQEDIKDLVPNVTESVPTGNNTSVKLERPLYYFDLKVAEKTCDSTLTRMSFMITEHEDRTELGAVNIKFECQDYGSEANINALDRSYIERARSLFKRQILSKLTPVETDDKTPRP